MNETGKITISPDEYNYIAYDISIDDFNTNYPNPYRIDRLFADIEKYKSYKRTQLRRATREFTY